MKGKGSERRQKIRRFNSGIEIIYIQRMQMAASCSTGTDTPHTRQSETSERQHNNMSGVNMLKNGSTMKGPLLSLGDLHWRPFYLLYSHLSLTFACSSWACEGFTLLSSIKASEWPDASVRMNDACCP